MWMLVYGRRNLSRSRSNKVSVEALRALEADKKERTRLIKELNRIPGIESDPSLFAENVTSSDFYKGLREKSRSTKDLETKLSELDKSTGEGVTTPLETTPAVPMKKPTTTTMNRAKDAWEAQRQSESTSRAAREAHRSR